MKQLLFFLLITLSNQSLAQTNSHSSNYHADSGYLTSFDGTKIYYEAWGEGRPVLMLHGFMNTGSTLKKIPLFDSLLHAGYRVILPDLRGNGKSDKPHNAEAYLHDAEAKDMMKLMDKLQIKKYAVFGYSRGAIIASRLLVLDKRAKCGILGGMGADFVNPDWPRRILFYHALRGDSVPELKEVIDYVKKAGLDRLSLAYQQNGQPSTSKEEFSKLEKPVLVICGDIDTADGDPQELAALIPHSIFITVPGNHGQAWISNEFTNKIIAYLQEINY